MGGAAMTVDLQLAKQKLAAAISSVPSGMESDVVLRPSTCGYCPTRLWFQERDRAAGLEREPREGRFDWYTLQGTVTEHVLRNMLEVAGARIKHPKETEVWGTHPETRFAPHVDGALRWLDVGITEWSFLEFKALRANDAIDIILGGLRANRPYWYQAVSYLMLPDLAAANTGMEPEWDFRPDQIKQLLFILSPKDPSTTRMLLAGRVKPTSGPVGTRKPSEDDEPPKRKPRTKTPEQVAKAEQRMQEWKQREAQKERWRERITEIGGLEFYMELVHADDPDVQETWAEIQKLPALVFSEEPPQPIHDSTLAPGDLDKECEFYCDYLTECAASKEATRA